MWRTLLTTPWLSRSNLLQNLTTVFASNLFDKAVAASLGCSAMHTLTTQLSRRHTVLASSVRNWWFSSINKIPFRFNRSRFLPTTSLILKVNSVWLFLNNNWDRDSVLLANVHTLSLGCHSRGTSNQERRLSFVHKGQNDIEDINCQTQNEVKKCQQHGTTDNTWRDCSAVMSLNQTLREAEYHISPSLYPSIPWRGDWLCNSTPNTRVCPKCQVTKGNYLNLDKTMSKGLNSRGANWTLSEDIELYWATTQRTEGTPLHVELLAWPHRGHWCTVLNNDNWPRTCHVTLK